MFTILGKRSSINVRKVLWLADELGLAYTLEEWGLPHRDPRAPEFLALNPNAQVPVLRDGEVTLWESQAIVLYLAHKHASALLPSEPSAHGRTLQWLIWQATELNPAWSYAVMALLRKTPGYDDAAQIARSIERWSAKMRILEEQLARTGAYAAGEAFGLADIALGLSVHRWLHTPFERPALPHVERYYAALAARPAAAAHLDPALG